MAELGLCIRSIDLNVRSFSRMAAVAEELGYGHIWVTEEIARSGFTMIAAAALHTAKITVGTAIVSIYSRTPLTIAMDAASLNEFSQSRFILGLGAGGLDFTTRGHGIPAEKPVARMREYITIIRNFLAGERFSYDGLFHKVRDMRLWIKPRDRIPIFVAALNKNMLRLAGEVADGVILNMFSPKAIQYVRENIGKGLEKAGRRAEDIKIYSFILTAASSSRDSQEYLRRAVAFYCVAPTYRGMLESMGFADVVEEIKTLWSRGEKDKLTERIPDELVEEVSVTADRGDAVERIEEYAKAGVTPILYPQPRKGREKQDIAVITSSFSKEK